MPELAATGCARRSVSFAGYAGRTGGCASHHHHLFVAPTVSGLVEHDASFSCESQSGGIAAGRHGVPEDNSFSTTPCSCFTAVCVTTVFKMRVIT